MPRSVLTISRALFVATLAAVTYLSLTPSPPSAAGRWDKLAHLLAYVVLAFLLVLSVPTRRAWCLGIVGLAVAIIAYGVMIEFIQTMTGRNFELADMAADAIGTTVGAAAGVVVRTVWNSVKPVEHG